MATSFSGGVTRREPPTMGKQLQSCQSLNIFEYFDRLESLNNFLSKCGINSIHMPTSSWKMYSKKNKDSYVQHVREVVYAVIRTIFPYEIQHVLEDFYNLSTDTTIEQTNETDSVLQEALIESYGKADTWQLKRQILSILAKTMHYKSIIEKNSRFNRISILQGQESLCSCNEQLRQRMDPHKLDIFLDFITSSHIIKDLPFGERKLRLSNGKVVETPNVIRCMAPAAIMQHCKQYCVENDEVPLGDSTMFKILAECSATVQKAFEGIDYYVAEGGRAFQDICSVVQDLCQVGALTNDKMKEYIDVAQECKRYLKTDYKVHITESSSVPDHCRIFALSDKLGTFGYKCEHEHDMVCVNCEQIHELLSSLTNLILESDLKEKEENRDDYQYKFSQAQSNIINWKTHVRTSHQEKAKSDIMANMGPNEVLLVLDWAMKYLPRRYREDQSNWLAKRGLSWHIGVAFRRRETIESLAFIHIFSGQISQDSNATSAVILDIIEELKERNDSVGKVHLWSDNAGCYKSSETISALFNSRSIDSYDFCEAQSGKGACDRTAATIKSGIRRYVNQGNDVLTVKQMKTAIEETSKKVHYVVKVVEVDSASAVMKTKVQIPSISAMNNFQFEESGVRVWKHYKLGPGKFIPYSINATIVQPSLEVIEKPKEMVDFHALVRSTVQTENQQNEGIFTCSNDGCMSSFNTHQELHDHAILDECNVQSEKIKKSDMLKTQYIKKLSEAQITPKEVTISGNCSEIESKQTLSQGWGIKLERKNKRFTENQKSFLIERFNIGVQTGCKEDPENVSTLMRNIKNADGSRRFSLAEFLTSQQIISFFSIHCRKNEAMREQTISDLENTLLH